MHPAPRRHVFGDLLRLGGILSLWNGGAERSVDASAVVFPVRRP